MPSATNKKNSPASALQPGAVRPRHTSRNSQAHPGVSPLSAVGHRNTSFQPLPRPLGLPPYHYSLTDNFPAIGANINAAKKMVFHVLGDSGGVQDGEFQNNIAEQMIKEVAAGGATVPQFCYHIGDVVYFTGMNADYYAQFYEPYARYEPPIFAIPGNHDGEVDDPKAQTSLDGWVEYFMQPTPDVDPISKDAPRVGLNLPNVYWTLLTPVATIIGMYTNVPEGGSIDSVQQQWVTNEFATAPTDRALILALHHPIFSFDVYHSGSSKMADVLENAIRDTGRVPNLVLSGHVHDYQRIEKTIAPGGATPFIVCGNGGYHNLHAIHSNPGDVAPDTGAVLKYGADKVWSVMTLTIDKKTIKGKTTEIDKAGNVKSGDSFSYPATSVVLKDPKSVPTL
ncbi:MAG: metallophosphoesterase [Bryobacteraceae bacterium]|jgi:Icc-related predicted phosphoesterase